jgi:hypothetical protein
MRKVRGASSNALGAPHNPRGGVMLQLLKEGGEGLAGPGFYIEAKSLCAALCSKGSRGPQVPAPPPTL